MDHSIGTRGGLVGAVSPSHRAVRATTGVRKCRSKRLRFHMNVISLTGNEILPVYADALFFTEFHTYQAGWGLGKFTKAQKRNFSTL